MKPLARFVSFAVGGVPPEVMGIGPIVAIPKALKLAGLDPEGVDIIRDDVRLGGAVADTGPQAGAAGEQVERLIDENRFEVDHLVGRDRASGHSGRRRRAGRHRGNH